MQIWITFAYGTFIYALFTYSSQLIIQQSVYLPTSDKVTG